ncbi:MAG: recombinase family protein [Phycisphaerales bacterium]|nr:MAG: recombinase family protein [Phycisphaerales bacterium]
MIATESTRVGRETSSNPVGSGTFGPGKIQPHRRDRLAVVYVRQSSAQQVLEHRESAALQYALRRRAIDWDWPGERVPVIDQDQGLGGTSAEGRTGFQRLLAEVSLDHVGLVLGIEMSRLARSCKDWHQLLKLCAVFGTLLVDQDGLYDPREYNARLLLGLRGTLSEAELHILRQRMHQGRLNKAKRGELFNHPPICYIRQQGGELALDPDEQVQGVVRLIFDQFDELGSINAVLRYCRSSATGDCTVSVCIRRSLQPVRRSAGVPCISATTSTITARSYYSGRCRSCRMIRRIRWRPASSSRSA